MRESGLREQLSGFKEEPSNMKESGLREQLSSMRSSAPREKLV